MNSSTEVRSEKMSKKRSLQRCGVEVLNYHPGGKKARISADKTKRPLRDDDENVNPQGKYGVSFAFVL